MIPRREFLQILSAMALQPRTSIESVKKLGEAAGMDLSDSAAEELLAVYRGIYEDTRLLRAMDIGDATPATVFEAE